jgi:hypothetical protein
MKYQVITSLSLHAFIVSNIYTWLLMLCVLLCFNRGGRVRLRSIVAPLKEFDHPQKGDALYGRLPTMHFMLICFCFE